MIRKPRSLRSRLPSAVRQRSALLDDKTLDGAAEIAALVGKPRHGEPRAIGTDQDLGIEQDQSPADRAKFTVRSALKVTGKSSTAEVPLQKSAAAIARIACETGAPCTIGRSTRYQIAPGPGGRTGRGRRAATCR
jgi:hypothetical protein